MLNYTTIEDISNNCTISKKYACTVLYVDLNSTIVTEIGKSNLVFTKGLWDSQDEMKGHGQEDESDTEGFSGQRLGDLRDSGTATGASRCPGAD